MLKKGDPLFEVWCEFCWNKVRDYRIINLQFKCECCITKQEAAALTAQLNADPATVSDEDWELPPGTFYKGDGENAA